MQKISNMKINAFISLQQQPVLVVVMLVCCGISGCGNKGPKLMPISGRVTFEGKPVGKGMIYFSNPTAGIEMQAELQEDGSYQVQVAKGAGLPAGNYAVAVVPPRINLPVGAPPPSPMPTYPDIPDKYRDPSTSGLSVKVESDSVVLDIDMKPGK